MEINTAADKDLVLGELTYKLALVSSFYYGLFFNESS